VLQARFHLITADPPRLDDLVKFLEADARPWVESLPASLGMSLYANPVLGVAVLESFWASRDELLYNENHLSMVPPNWGEVMRRVAATVTVERYRVPVFERKAPRIAGAGLRLTRADIEPPSRVEDMVEFYGDTAVPWLADTEEFCGALFLVDRDTGHSIAETTWWTGQAMAATRSLAAAVRVKTVESTGCVIRAVEEYALVFDSARKA
jgi:hypothetical protein